MSRVLDALLEWLHTPQQDSLRRAFAAWLRQVALPQKFPDYIFSQDFNQLSEVRSMLAETIQEWYAQATAEGRAQGEVWGKAIGTQKGTANSLIFILEKKFAPLSENQRTWIHALPEEALFTCMGHCFQANSVEEVLALAQHPVTQHTPI